jgi:hypothetical protein
LFIPILCINNHLYGSSFSFAYTSNANDDPTILNTASTNAFLKIRQIILPFGVNLGRISAMAYAYIFVLMPWFSVGLVVMFFWFLRQAFLIAKKKLVPETRPAGWFFSAGQTTYMWLFGVVSLWLVVYYGSYEFTEYFDRTKILLGSSYLRYWLPIFVFGLPVCVLGFEKISRMFAAQRVRRAVMIVFIASFSFFSVNLALLDPLHGLAQLKRNMASEKSLSETVDRITPADAIIISGFADKVFFPSRRVIVAMPEDPRVFAKTAQLIAAAVPLYFYYNPLDASAVQAQSMFTQQGYTMEVAEHFTEGNTTLFSVGPD